MITENKNGLRSVSPTQRICTFLLLAVFVITATYISYDYQMSQATLSKIGSRGDEVRTIQQKLKRWGYYDGSVDSIYGSKTAAAVKLFQKKNGLAVDGIAGPATLAALGIFNTESSGATSGTVSGSINDTDTYLLARLINGEARGETYEGQVAVGAVVLNRVRHPSFPNSISGVIYQPQAFTAVDDGQINAQVKESCIRAARDALNGWDPTGGAIYYYNPVTATNKWIRSRPVVATIGKHVFCF